MFQPSHHLALDQITVVIYKVLHKDVQTLVQLAAAMIWKWCGKVCLVKTKSTASKTHWCDWALCTEPVFYFTIERSGYFKKNQHIIVRLFSSFRPFCWTHNTGHHVCPPVTTQTATICPAVKSMLWSFTKFCQQTNFGLKSNNNSHYMKTYMNISAHFSYIP